MLTTLLLNVKLDGDIIQLPMLSTIFTCTEALGTPAPQPNGALAKKYLPGFPYNSWSLRRLRHKISIIAPLSASFYTATVCTIM